MVTQTSLASLAEDMAPLPVAQRYGRLSAVRGLVLEVAGISRDAEVGGRLRLQGRSGGFEPLEIIGFEDGVAHCLPLSERSGRSVGAKAYIAGEDGLVRPGVRWLGRVISGLGEPIDGKGPLIAGPHPRPVRSTPPAAHARQRVGARMDLGVKALDVFAPCCVGQRLGIFAGSGVGKSVLMAMLARGGGADVNVIGLIGERGREVQEFIEDDLGPEGMARSVVIVATSDEPALMRRQAAFMTMAVAEFFRDEGLHVLCMMDSITRFAMAQREIGLSCGEPPATKGYTPTVFAELPRLLERAGPGGPGQGAITGLFTVLVDGDDHNEPIADAVRGILDGHVVMERAIAERGRYPAINVLKSVSRTLPGAHSDAENALLMQARRHLATYMDMAEMIRLGAYRRGSDADVDAALFFAPQIEAFLMQAKQDSFAATDAFLALQAILSQAPDEA